MGWLALAGASIVLGLFGLAAWARRGESRGDRPGERTCATFRAPSGPESSPSEPAGLELARELSATLAKLGTTTDAPALGDGHGWDFATGDAYIELIATDEGAWAITIVDGSSGGPGPIAIACAIDRALREMNGVTGVRWHARGSFDPFDVDGGHEHPMDVRSPTYRS